MSQWTWAVPSTRNTFVYKMLVEYLRTHADATVRSYALDEGLTEKETLELEITYAEDKAKGTI